MLTLGIEAIIAYQEFIKVAVYRYAFNDIHSYGQCISNYYKLFAKNLVLYKYLNP